MIPELPMQVELYVPEMKTSFELSGMEPGVNTEALPIQTRLATSSLCGASGPFFKQTGKDQQRVGRHPRQRRCFIGLQNNQGVSLNPGVAFKRSSSKRCLRTANLSAELANRPICFSIGLHRNRMALPSHCRVSVKQRERYNLEKKRGTPPATTAPTLSEQHRRIYSPLTRRRRRGGSVGPSLDLDCSVLRS